MVVAARPAGAQMVAQIKATEEKLRSLSESNEEEVTKGREAL